ncbi:hypothetical protein NBRC116601_26150 [Cognatishimia sp. WU-CL00825]|uniref:hypothetical protein n=1 Tax=Cognatishimia sp. WU-CL00825 TaxID=3127658 RepID=UPI00310C3205
MRFFLTLILALAPLGPALAKSVFPTVTSEDLNGAPKTLPAELPGDPTIVFVAYKRQQQEAVNTWISALDLDPSQGTEFVEIPVVGGATKLIRNVVDNGMRSGIVDTDMRARTITLYENASFVNDPLGFVGRNQIRVLIVRQNGEVLWSTSGPATDIQVNALKEAFIAAQ